MYKFTIILQGACTDITPEIISTYKALPFVSKIILSSYQDTLDFDLDPDVLFVDNQVIKPAGTGNRNLQINTTLNGLAECRTELCAKMRTDQLIRPASMQLMYDFWLANEPADNDRDAVPRGRIYVCGLYHRFPYHPRDHVFWGYTQDIKRLFDIPFDPDMDQSQSYNVKVRAETYIGQYYFARFDPRVLEHIARPQTYLVDGAPKLAEAMAIDAELKDQLFKAFPRISLRWPKHGLEEYHYHVGQQYSEYWDES